MQTSGQTAHEPDAHSWESNTLPGSSALDTLAKIEMAARSFGVELRVVGAESCERTGLSARVRKGGKMSPELSEAVRKLRVGLVARLLAREHIIGGVLNALAPLLEQRSGGRVALGDIWPQACLEAQVRFGRRCARLYPLLEGTVLIVGKDGSAVSGTLEQAFSNAAMVLVPTDPPIHPFEDPQKTAYVPARFVAVADVWPVVPGAVSRPRHPRTRPHDGEAGLRALPAGTLVEEGEGR